LTSFLFLQHERFVSVLRLILEQKLSASHTRGGFVEIEDAVLEQTYRKICNRFQVTPKSLHQGDNLAADCRIKNSLMQLGNTGPSARLIASNNSNNYNGSSSSSIKKGSKRRNSVSNESSNNISNEGRTNSEYPASISTNDDSITDVTDAGNSKHGKRLAKSAIAVMTKWLVDNQVDPYPNQDTKQELALKTGLTARQVDFNNLEFITNIN